MSCRVVPRVVARAAVFSYVVLILALGAGSAGAQFADTESLYSPQLTSPIASKINTNTCFISSPSS